MILILEIAMVVLAAKRGWKWWAVLPLVLGLGVGFGFGFLAASSGWERGSIMIAALLIDATVILVLIFMSVVGGPYKNRKKRKTDHRLDPEPAKLQHWDQPRRPPAVDGYKMLSERSVN